MSAALLRCQPCGPAGPERRSICARSRQRIRRRPRQSQSSCVNAIRHAALMTSDRSRSPSLRNFLTGPRASCRDRTCSSTSTAITPFGRIPRRALLTSSSSTWPSPHAKALHAASTITTLALTRWRRSASPQMSSKRCWRKLKTRWARPLRPQILITIAARFGRISWKYSSIAYALILKDVGVLTQALYLMTADMGLGGCAIGITNIDLFAKMTGVEFHVEGPVGQFAIGRGAKSEASD